MMKHRIVPIILLAVIIFLSGFFLRLGNYNLPDKNLYYDDNGLQYFQESDSYYNYRLTRNLLEHGHLGDKIIDGRSWDLHSYYPPGVPVDYPPLLPHIAVGFYLILNLIGSVSLKEACLWLPTIISPLAGIIGFLFSRRISGEFGGFITGILIVTAPLYVFKTNFGFFDTDMLNIIFPLLIVWSLFEAENAKTRKYKIILAGCSGFFLFLFSFAWNGWIYYFYIIIAALIYNLIKERNFDMILPFILISIPLIGIFNILGFYSIILTPTQLGYLTGQENIWYPWPDSYKNVAELQKPTMETFITIISPLILVLGFAGLATTIYSKNIKSLTKSIIIIWTISSILSIFAGARFAILLIPPLSILAGMFWRKFENTLKNILKSVHKQKIISILQLTLLSLIFLQFFSLFNLVSGYKPMYDDYFMEAAQWIDNNTPENTIIITDWSYGHFFASEANRPVVFDGRLAYIETLPIREYWYPPNLDPRIPTTARDYWINLALTTDNPTLSKNILRMLTTSGDQAYILLNNYTHNRKRASTILEETLASNRTLAYFILKRNGLSDEQAIKVLNYTHPTNPRPFILIINTDMENQIIDTAANYQGTPYSIIENGTEKFVDKKGNFSIIITKNKTLIVNKNYRNSLIVKLLTGEGDSMKVFENKKIKIIVFG
ncbi:MAG: dolichyl-phosphooligosaccharide-protein glycotransferase [Methanobacteriaceae archaeon]|nr:dolichyl-phosphooligosaccharide-protein glycotransferase [Methanobacteriaceae archaeon]